MLQRPPVVRSVRENIRHDLLLWFTKDKTGDDDIAKAAPKP